MQVGYNYMTAGCNTRSAGNSNNSGGYNRINSVNRNSSDSYSRSNSGTNKAANQPTFSGLGTWLSLLSVPRKDRAKAKVDIAKSKQEAKERKAFEKAREERSKVAGWSVGRIPLSWDARRKQIELQYMAHYRTHVKNR